MKKIFNRFVIQLIAIGTMTIDHIGVVLIPYGTGPYFVLRTIGRIAFPLFAFLLVEGFYHTRSITKYLLRILILGLVFELSFDIGMLFIDGLEKLQMNIFLTLFTGLLTITLLKSKKWYLKVLSLVPISYVIITDLFINNISIGTYQIPICLEYGIYGIAVILLFAFTADNNKRFVGFLILTSIFTSPGYLTMVNSQYPFIQQSVQYASILALVPIAFYNGKIGVKIPKLITYLYYPVHLLILYGIFILINIL